MNDDHGAPPTGSALRLFLVLWLAGIGATMLLTPVSGWIAEAQRAGAAADWREAYALPLISAAVLYAAVLYLGLRLAARFGLGAPMLGAWLAGGRVEGVVRTLVSAAALGAAAAVAVVFVAVVLRTAHIGPGAGIQAELPLASGVPLALFAAVNDEIFFRLGVMTGAVWFTTRLLPATEGGPSKYAMWFSVALSALFYEISDVTPLGIAGPADAADIVVSRALRLVGIAVGALFGWLYWRRGLESAMVAHLAYALVLFYGIVVAV
jgi:hypothetical protein